MVFHKSITIYTEKYNEMILITEQILKAVENSGMKNGTVTAVTRHTTTGITVNEALECLESDILQFLERLVPEDFPYSHARMLRSYGSTAGNATGHLKAHITGNHCVFPIINGELVKGEAQEIYFCEFDGPAKRTISICVMGD